MRDFGAPVGVDVRKQIAELCRAIYEAVPKRREVWASDFAMEESPDRIVVREADVRWDEGRLRVAVTEADARPPFEWFWEISSDVGESDYFKHYLVREHDVVLAQRKVLTPIDAVEVKIVLGDLREAQAHLSAD